MNVINHRAITGQSNQSNPFNPLPRKPSQSIRNPDQNRNLQIVPGSPPERNNRTEEINIKPSMNKNVTTESGTFLRKISASPVNIAAEKPLLYRPEDDESDEESDNVSDEEEEDGEHEPNTSNNSLDDDQISHLKVDVVLPDDQQNSNSRISTDGLENADSKSSLLNHHRSSNKSINSPIRKFCKRLSKNSSNFSNKNTAADKLRLQNQENSTGSNDNNNNKTDERNSVLGQIRLLQTSNQKELIMNERRAFEKEMAKEKAMWKQQEIAQGLGRKSITDENSFEETTDMSLRTSVPGGIVQENNNNNIDQLNILPSQSLAELKKIGITVKDSKSIELDKSIDIDGII